jgi:hypothetical protein
MNIKRIEMDWQMGSNYDIWRNAVTLAKEHYCEVSFPFNGNVYIVNHKSIWSTDVHEKIMNNIGKGVEVML